MKDKINRSSLSDVVSFLVWLVIFFSAINHGINFNRLRNWVRFSPITANFSEPVAYVILAAELSTVLLLLWRKYRIVGLYSSFLLLVVFTGYILTIMWLRHKMPRSFDGIWMNIGWFYQALINFFLLGLTFIGIILNQRETKLHQTKYLKK